jgi:energy-coupling factor transporter ATP-binding protein EcfA2
MSDAGSTKIFKAGDNYFTLSITTDDSQHHARPTLDYFQRVLCHFEVDKYPSASATGDSPPHHIADKRIKIANALLRISHDHPLINYDLRLNSLPAGKPHQWVAEMEPEIINDLVASMHGLFWFHGACLAKDNSIIFLVGHSGAGKTTTSLALLAQGYRLITDDIVLINLATQFLQPFPRCPKIRRGAATLLAAAGFNLHHESELRDNYVILNGCHINYHRHYLPEKNIRLFFLHKDDGRKSGKNRLSLSEALIQLMKHANIYHQDPDFSQSSQLLANAACFELSVGTTTAEFNANIAAILQEGHLS